MAGRFDYNYPAEKFAAARRALMLPHLRGEDDSIHEALREIGHGLHRFDPELLDDTSRPWIHRISEVRAAMIEQGRALTLDEKIDLSHVVDELAHWFARRRDEQ